MSINRIETLSAAVFVKSSATLVWIFLIAATVVSWLLGTDHSFINSHTTASVIILLVAFVKVRFIGLYFMELKDAPLPLRLILEGWCLIVCGLVVGLYLAG